MVDDSDLLEAWRAGDAAAGRELFDRYFGGLHRFFVNKVASGIDDLVQETFLACVESKDRLRNAASFRAFLFAVARRRLYRRWRNERSGAGAIDLGLLSVQDLGPSPSTGFRAKREQEALLSALRRLPVDLQIPLELYYWDGLSTVELAGVLDVPEGTVRSRMRRAREQLREMIEAPDPATLERQLGAAREVVSPASS